MANKTGLFEVRISVFNLGDDPQQESDVVNAIAAQFLEMGVNNITVIANKEQVDYVDNEVHPASPAHLFSSNPEAPIDVHIQGQG